jgi:hypothetical protein
MRYYGSSHFTGVCLGKRRVERDSSWRKRGIVAAGLVGEAFPKSLRTGSNR